MLQFCLAQGHLARESFARKIFKQDLWSPGAGFFPTGTINLLSLKRRIDSDFKNNFVIMKRDKPPINVTFHDLFGHTLF
jgi:hypothetical protein